MSHEREREVVGRPVSHHMRVLSDRRVVSRRKAGRIVDYCLADQQVRHVFEDGLRHVRESAAAMVPSA